MNTLTLRDAPKIYVISNENDHYSLPARLRTVLNFSLGEAVVSLTKLTDFAVTAAFFSHNNDKKLTFLCQASVPVSRFRTEPHEKKTQSKLDRKKPHGNKPHRNKPLRK